MGGIENPANEKAAFPAASAHIVDPQAISR
jgi:hypothetical protein